MHRDQDSCFATMAQDSINTQQKTVDDVRFLPEALLGEILDYLLLQDTQFFFATCNFLWNEFRTQWERECRSLKGLTPKLLIACTPASPTATMIHGKFLDGFHNLESLDLGSKSTDGFLQMICPLEDDSGSFEEGKKLLQTSTREELLPRLRHISMVRSTSVTDYGLDYISRGKHRKNNLESIDITFCQNTTYEGTFLVRDRLSNLKCIRRQPQWLDGSFVTPFGITGHPKEEAEVHVYWADGTFSFNRTTQSSGFVCELFEWNENDSNYLGDKLQYTDFQRPEQWPEWCKYCYRPGVSLLNSCDKRSQAVMSKEDVRKQRSVLVAQRLSGIRPPDDFPTVSNCNDVPLGHSRFFDDLGNPISDLDDRDIPTAAARSHATTMVSRMPVLPLPNGGSPLPPDEIVQRNRAFCNELKQAVRAGIFMEIPSEVRALVDEEGYSRRILEAGETVLDMELSRVNDAH